MSYENLTPLTQEEIERIGVKESEPGYPPLSNRLIVPRDQWDQMVAENSIIIPDDPAYHITDHPNRRNVAEDQRDDIATVGRPMSAGLVAYWKSLGLHVDTAGRPLHPRAAEVLPVTGMYTGPGWSYRYGPQRIGNLGLRRTRNSRVEYAVVAVQRRTVMWGLPGGYAEMGETPRQAAFREGSEEAGVDLRKQELQRLVGRLVLRDVLARLKCSPKDTLHAWLEEWFTIVHSPENPALEGVELRNGDTEVLEMGWMEAAEIVSRKDFLGTHKRVVRAHEGMGQ
ncbi:MAG TPA: NUDIX domain-containing protein [Candidatus Saccharimonadales bacterium]|nr:NUDIX domain-containing protein [Candidatus Saccharimonadales bacterium]